jgi:AraC-like DNA-binding protein
VTQEPSFTNAVVFETPLIRIGAFRCDRAYPGFQNTGPAKNDCFVFPRTAVEIEHDDAPAFVANPNVVTFYNQSQRYQRHEISKRGDHCDWFGVHRDLARDSVRMVEPDVEETPFPWHRGRCDAKTYVTQRRLFEGVAAGLITDPVAVEETVLQLLARVLGVSAPQPPDRKSHELVREVERLLAARFEQRLTLHEIAAYAGASLFHLCRIFHAITGLALHQYIRQLRIRHGLERVSETKVPLSRIAVDLGFTHHSHFTSAFHRDFEVTPSAVRVSRFRY